MLRLPGPGLLLGTAPGFLFGATTLPLFGPASWLANLGLNACRFRRGRFLRSPKILKNSLEKC